MLGSTTRRKVGERKPSSGEMDTLYRNQNLTTLESNYHINSVSVAAAEPMMT